MEPIIIVLASGFVAFCGIFIIIANSKEKRLALQETRYSWRGAIVLDMPDRAVLTPEQERMRHVERTMSIASQGRIIDDDFEHGTLIGVNRANGNVLRVWNSTPESDGKRKSYYLRVPPHIRTAKEARAWTFGMRQDEFVLAKET